MEENKSEPEPDLMYVSYCQAREIFLTNVKNKKGLNRHNIQSIKSGEKCH